MRKNKLIELIARKQGIKLSVQEIGILDNILTDKFEQNKDKLFQDYTCYCIRRKLEHNIFKLPIDCLYIWRTVERIAYKEEGDKLFTSERDDKITIRYLSSQNPLWSKIEGELSDYIKQLYLNKQ